jgi:mannose-1-phosphate guanylyltransferase
MNRNANDQSTRDWVIVLAAGSGTRLGSMTVDDRGAVVPKQFCSLRGGRSLLLDTLDRALHLAPAERVVVVVAAQHEAWWRPQLACLPAANVIVQPNNRGTTAGILLPLAHVLGRDAAANVAVLPSDHYVARPNVLTASMRAALARSAVGTELVLLGIAPDAPDTEYGWIAAGPARDGVQTVAAFVEKPPLARATTLMAAGAYWNSFLFAGRGAAIWRLCARHAPAIAASVAAAVLGGGASAEALAAAYADMPNCDFSASVLGQSAGDLRLLCVPHCGWTDLGTPRRVAECLRGLELRDRSPRRPQWFATVDLSTAMARESMAVSA